jgi:hypothetical protein
MLGYINTNPLLTLNEIERTILREVNRQSASIAQYNLLHYLLRPMTGVSFRAGICLCALLRIEDQVPIVSALCYIEQYMGASLTIKECIGLITDLQGIEGLPIEDPVLSIRRTTGLDITSYQGYPEDRLRTFMTDYGLSGRESDVIVTTSLINDRKETIRLLSTHWGYDEISIINLTNLLNVRYQENR